MPARTPLIAGNWKMNTLPAEAGALAAAAGEAAAAVFGRAEVCVCPPFTSLAAALAALQGAPAAVGAQDCHAEASGAHTGDTAAEMLAAMGCAYVIVGHSERRTDHGETDAAVRAKAAAARRAGLTAIICVGETLAEREAGATEAVVERQIRGSVPEGARAADTVIAYEPVWAIGTGKTASPADAQAVHAHIRAVLTETMSAAGEAAAVRILYGGSMKPDNAAGLLAEADIDGGLIGGASLDAGAFAAVIKAAGA
ncbi:MAG: triose-phosphate isomerase [Rhodospirillales bacterium]